MAIEDRAPITMKPVSGNTSWANFTESVELGWTDSFNCSYDHQNGSLSTPDHADACEWQEFSHKQSDPTNREEGNHTEPEIGWNDINRRESKTEWNDFSNAEPINSEWQDFSRTRHRTESSSSGDKFNPSFSSSVSTESSNSCEVFHQCFPPTSVCKARLSLPFHPLNACRKWSELVDTSHSVLHPPTCFEQRLNKLLTSLDPNASIGALQLDLPADNNSFEWSNSTSPPLVSPGYFRPEKPESPVDINFDHCRAALGLASLSEKELQEMHSEMESKFEKLSEVLISELQDRDLMASQLDTKNSFIAALLRVQVLKHTSSIGTIDPIKSLRTRARSLSHSTRSADEKSSGKFLQSVVPYHLPEDGHWKASTLQHLTKILHAIAEDSGAVPGLVSTYIQSEVFVTSEEKDQTQ